MGSILSAGIICKLIPRARIRPLCDVQRLRYKRDNQDYETWPTKLNDDYKLADLLEDTGACID